MRSKRAAVTSVSRRLLLSGAVAVLLAAVLGLPSDPLGFGDGIAPETASPAGAAPAPETPPVEDGSEEPPGELHGPWLPEAPDVPDEPVVARMPPPPPGDLPEERALSADLLELKASLVQAIADYAESPPGLGIHVAVAVTDLQTGEHISVNGNRPQRTGCTIMLFGLLAVVREFQAGNASPGDVAGHIRRGIGGSYPPEMRRLFERVFGSLRAGVEASRDVMAAAGLRTSLFDHLPYYGNGAQDNYLTALEVNLALAKLYRGELFDAGWTGYALGRLQAIDPDLNYMLPKPLPAGARIAHKMGYAWDTDGWIDNDAGIVTYQGADGTPKAYAVTYLSERAPTEYGGYSFAARVSRIVWDRFAGRYPPAPAPRPAPAQPEAVPQHADRPAAPTASPAAPPAPTPTPPPTAPAPSVVPPAPSAAPAAPVAAPSVQPAPLSPRAPSGGTPALPAVTPPPAPPAGTVTPPPTARDGARPSGRGATSPGTGAGASP